MRRMIAWLPLLALSALAGLPAPPLAEASRAPDGTYTLIVQPDDAWTTAEVTVLGDVACDFDRIEEDQHVRVDGWTDRAGPLQVVIQAVTPQHHGITWSFSVDPTSVPVGAPVFTPAPPSRGLGAWVRRWWP